MNKVMRNFKIEYTADYNGQVTVANGSALPKATNDIEIPAELEELKSLVALDIREFWRRKTGEDVGRVIITKVKQIGIDPKPVAYWRLLKEAALLKINNNGNHCQQIDQIQIKAIALLDGFKNPDQVFMADLDFSMGEGGIITINGQ